MDIFRVIEEKRNIFGTRRRTLLKTESVEEAMHYVRTVEEPLKMRNAFELVADGGFDDEVHANKINRIFEYENTKTGDMIEYMYYIKREVCF